MKVLGIYDKNSNLKCYDKNIFITMKKYLAHYPEEYSQNYYQNLKTLKLLKVDKIIDNITVGKYNQDNNVIMFINNNSLGHELFHMASNDLTKFNMAIEGPFDIEQGLIEGMTEYLFMDAYHKSEPSSYHFEVFCTTMLSEIENLFKSYFVPSHEEFIKLFPNKKAIYSLLYALNTYHDKMIDYLLEAQNNTDATIDTKIVNESIRHVIDNLISIKLSFKSDDKLWLYCDKFMDLITSKCINETLSWVYPDYSSYAFNTIKKRLRSRC